nr:immunoglobulin heavy chain junction region [Mus musculus]
CARPNEIFPIYYYGSSPRNYAMDYW